ncbi:MAG TPA: response regulator [Candidatus Paceibacterota bacterium]|nr:response regulator [Candidatus Paceibacterota bacterium]
MEKTTKEKYTIAIIEDEVVMSKPLAEALEEAGFEVIKASDGKAGLYMVLKEEPDLILLDIVMPNMDGMTMMNMLRKSGEFGKHVPIILLTNLNVDDKAISDVAKYEPAYYLVKSEYTLDEVVAKVRNCLKELPSGQ